MNIKALYLISYGLYLVGSKKGDKLNAQIAFYAQGRKVFQVI